MRSIDFVHLFVSLKTKVKFLENVNQFHRMKFSLPRIFLRMHNIVNEEKQSYNSCICYMQILYYK